MLESGLVVKSLHPVVQSLPKGDFELFNNDKSLTCFAKQDNYTSTNKSFYYISSKPKASSQLKIPTCLSGETCFHLKNLK